MKEWKVVFTKQAKKDARKIADSGLREKTQELLEILKQNPFQPPRYFENLVGDLSGAYSRRINIQHRLVYQMYEKERIAKVIRMWTRSMNKQQFLLFSFRLPNE